MIMIIIGYFSLLTFRVMSVGHFAPFDLEGENAHPSWRLVPTTSFHEVHEFIPMKFYVIFSLTCLIWGSNVWVRYPSWKLSPQPTPFYPYVKVLFTVYRVNNILYMHPLDQYPTFIMLWDVANLRPIRNRYVRDGSMLWKFPDHNIIVGNISWL